MRHLTPDRTSTRRSPLYHDSRRFTGIHATPCGSEAIAITSAARSVARAPPAAQQSCWPSSREQTMKQILITAVAALFALPMISIGSTAVSAYDYCRLDVTGHMTGCSFSTMEQCEGTRYGLGGDCFRDPFLDHNSNAYAYQPTYPGSGTNERRAAASRRWPGTRIAKDASPSPYRRGSSRLHKLANWGEPRCERYPQSRVITLRVCR
jgi:hypothetical protein